VNLILGIDGLEPEYVPKMKFVESLKSKSIYGWHECFKCGQKVPHTGPNWMTLYTAKPPEEHGVTFGGWTEGETDLRNFDTIFDKINCAVVDMPVTWKAKKIDGWMFSGFPSAHKICYPDGFIRYFTWGLAGDLVIELNQEEISKDVFESNYYNNEEEKFWSVMDLVEEYPVDNLFYGISMLDHFGHFLSIDKISQAYKWVDSQVQKFNELLDIDKLIIVSDHGFNFRKKQHDDFGFHIFYPNKSQFERNSILDVAKHTHRVLTE